LLNLEKVGKVIFMKSNLRNYLRSKAHNTEPTVMVGKEGASDAVVFALDQSLLHHELVKVKFQSQKDKLKELSNELAKKTNSELISTIGFISIYYRASEKKLIEIPKSLLR
jgi:RNA-binding protein